jgi:hypothetical protein
LSSAGSAHSAKRAEEPLTIGYATAPEEVAMFVMAVHQTPSLTQERYEEVVRRLTNGKSRLESPSDLPFDGLLVHIAGQSRNGFCVVGVF